MAIYRRRFPSAKDTFRIFLLCIALFHTWSIITYLYRIPGLILYLNMRDLFIIGAYILLFVFLECTIITLSLSLIATILPHNFLRQDFIHRASLFILFSFLWFMVFQTLEMITNSGQSILSSFVREVISEDHSLLVTWITSKDYASLTVTAIWVTWYFGVVGLIPRITEFSPKIIKFLDLILDRIDVLSYLFIFLDITSILTVLIRNLH